MQHPVLTPLLSANTTSLLNPAARPDAILLSRNETAAILEMNGETRGPLLNRVLNSNGSANLMNHSQPNSPPITAANPVVQTIASSRFHLNFFPLGLDKMVCQGFEANDENSGITTIFSSIHGNAKKRKLSDDGPVVYVKQEKKESTLGRL